MTQQLNMIDNITPTDEQWRAIQAIVAWYFDPNGPLEFYVAGFAGVGKTTIVQFAIRIIRERRKKGMTVRTAAYTGKAAHVLRQKGIEDAMTIHMLIYSPRRKKKEDDEGRQAGAPKNDVHFRLNVDGPASDADLVVLDECSMVDEKLAEDLRSFKKKILVMGDPGQLPPVKGQGAFTNRRPDFFLETIHRQAADSPIIELATMARQGKRLPNGYHKGLVMVTPLTKESQQMVYLEGNQPICGLNRVRWVYNKRIRTLRGFYGEVPQPGEKIICCRNNHAEGLFNGAMGTLKFVDEITSYNDAPAYEFSVDMEDLQEPINGLAVDPHLFHNHFNNGTSQKIEVPKKQPMLDEFDWAYILTCHKAQGSQFRNVTVVDDSQAFRENAAKWLYTCLTRAEVGLTVLTRD